MTNTNYEIVSATDIQRGDRIRYRDLDVTVVSDREPDENQFGLPWFRYKIEADDGRWGYARFGDTGRVPRYSEGVK